MYKKPFEATDGPKIMLYAFAFMLLAQLVFSFAVLAIPDSNPAYITVNLIGMLAFQAIYLTVYLVYTYKKGIKSSFSPRNKLTVWSVVAGAALAVVCMFCFMGFAYLFEKLLTDSGYLSQGIDVNSGLDIALLVVATVLAAPICEETVFRSAFLSGVTRVRKDEIGTCFLCGLCFALMHINPEQTVYQFCLGTVAAYLVIKTRSVIPSMALHGTSNALALVLSYTSFGQAIDGFYMGVGNIWIMLLTCVALPVVGCVIIFFVCRALKKIEQKKYPDKFVLPKVVWIDEQTHEPVYEGGNVPKITPENRTVFKGYSPMTGVPVYVDRLELQEALMSEYKKSSEDPSNKKSYKTVFAIYFVVTIVLWLMQLGAGYILNLIM